MNRIKLFLNRNNESFLLDAIRYEDYDTKNRILTYASKKLKSDSNFMIKVVKIAPYLVEYASNELKGSKDFMNEVAKQDGFYAVKYCNKVLSDDRDYVYSAISSGKFAHGFRYVSDRLRMNEDVSVFREAYRIKF